MLRMVQDYLDLEALEGGALAIDIETLDLRDLAEQAVTAHRPVASQKEIELELTGHERLWIQADADRLRQVVDNLVTNAIKFSSPGTRVRVEAAARNGAAELSVRDQGPGLTESDGPDSFRSSDASARARRVVRRVQASGLYTARLLIEQMTGTIRADNNPDRGATFSFRLPRALPGS